MNRTTKKSLAEAQAKLLSRQTGVAFIHEFSDGYQVSIAKGSSVYIIAEYHYGKLIKTPTL